MPRKARQKPEGCLFHVMSRSISEIDLFQSDEDKNYYLMLLQRYIEKFMCRVHAYCLMNNHVHLFINPCGFDISTFMRCLNTAYVTYYNRRYQRHGHLFQGRFTSVVVDDNTYVLKLSAYIHNNPKDLPGYAGKEEQYRYSSLGIYTGHRKDIERIVDTEFLLGYFSKDKNVAREKYRMFIESTRETEFMNEVDDDILRACKENDYRSEKRCILRDRAPEELIDRIRELLGEDLPMGLRTKYSRETSKTRAFVIYVLRVLGGFTYKEAGEYIGNMSLSGISRLSNEGFKLLQHAKYRDAFNSLIQVK